MPQSKAKLGKILLKLGLLTKDELKQVLSAQQIFGGRLGTNTVNLNLLTVDQVSNALAAQKGMPEATQELFLSVSARALDAIAPDMCGRYKVFPLHVQGRILHCAMRDPDSLTLVDEVAFAIGMRLRPYVVPELRLAYYLEKHYDIPRERHLQAYMDTPEEGAVTSRATRATMTGRPGMNRRPSAQNWPVAPTPVSEAPEAPLARARRSTGKAPSRPGPEMRTGIGHDSPTGLPLSRMDTPAPGTGPVPAPRKRPSGTRTPGAPRRKRQVTGPHQPAAAGPETISLDDYQVPSEVTRKPPPGRRRMPTGPPQATSMGHGGGAPAAPKEPLPEPEYQPGRPIAQQPTPPSPWDEATQDEQDQPPTSEWQQVNGAAGWDDEPSQTDVGYPDDALYDPVIPLRRPSKSLTESSLEFELSDLEETDAAFANRGPAGFHLHQPDAPLEGESISQGSFPEGHTPLGYEEATLDDPPSIFDDVEGQSPAVEVTVEETVPSAFFEEQAAATVASIKERLDPILDSLDAAQTKDAILSALVDPFLDITPLSVIFIPRKDEVAALLASGAAVDQKTLRGMSFALENSPHFKRAFKDRQVTCGRAEDDPMQEIIANHLGTETPTEVMVVPILIGERVVSLLCVHATPGRSFDALARALYQRLAHQAALAFARLIANKK